MAAIPGTETTLDLLIYCKTYPSVSERYFETVCTGGIDREGNLVRLFPVQFRFLDADSQFGKWDVIRVNVATPTGDTRPESRYFVGLAEQEPIDKLTTDRQRWKWVCKAVFDSQQAMLEAGRSLATVPICLEDVRWKHADQNESARRRRLLEQGDLFMTAAERNQIAELVGYEFLLDYTEPNAVGPHRTLTKKLLEWHYYQAFRRLRRDLGEEAAIQEVCDRLKGYAARDDKQVFLLCGTHSRFPETVLAAGLFWLDRSIVDSPSTQMELF